MQANGWRAALLVMAVWLIASCRKSAATLEQECTRGTAASCVAVGDMYLTGNGVAEDKEKAAQLFERACEGRASQGCDKARQMYEGLCDQGNGVACSYLARMYLEGFGVAQDPAKAATLSEKACDQSDAVSCSNLALQYFEGKGVTPDSGKAVDLWRRACEGGFSEACERASRGRP